MTQVIDNTKGIGQRFGIESEIPKPKELVLSRSAKVVRIPKTLTVGSPEYKKIVKHYIRQGYVLEDNFSLKKTIKKVGSKVKKIGKKVGTGIKKGSAVVSGVKKLASGDPLGAAKAFSQVKSKSKPKKKTAGDAVIAPLKPMMKTMKKGLEAKGVKTAKMSDVNVIEQFHNKFVSNQNNPTSKYDALPDGYLEKHPIFNTDLDNYDFQDSIDAVQIGSIVTSTIDYFKKLKDAKKAGTKLTETEKTIAVDTEKKEQELIDKAKGETPIQQNDMKKYIKWVVIALAAALVLWFIMKKAK